MALSFAEDIRPLFRDTPDVDTMKEFGMDLSAYDDVKTHAEAIYSRLERRQHAMRRTVAKSAGRKVQAVDGRRHGAVKALPDPINSQARAEAMPRRGIRPIHLGHSHG